MQYIASNIAHTHRSRGNMGPMRNHLYPLMTCKNSPIMRLKKSKKSLAAS